MGKKIFVTYKYADPNVRMLPSVQHTTVRDYVAELIKLLNDEDHVYKGEKDGEDLSHFKDETIASTLKGKIFDSSVTLIMISKGMKDLFVPEDDQWIPWEISYSLKELVREQSTSKTNAVMAVVLPDEFGSYEYYIRYNSFCNSNYYDTDFLFGIIRRNMFNLINPVTSDCNGNRLYHGNFSYIHNVKWHDFINDIDKHVDIAVNIKDNMNDYEVSKTVD